MDLDLTPGAAALKKQRADQDLIQPSRKVGEIAKIYVDQGKISKDKCPTIDKAAILLLNER